MAEVDDDTDIDLLQFLAEVRFILDREDEEEQENKVALWKRLCYFIFNSITD